MVRPFAPDVNPEANVRNADQVLQQVREGKVGSLFNGVGAELGRRIQQVATEESRLGIPVILAADVIHGMRTVFPIPLGEAASFEPDLAERTARHRHRSHRCRPALDLCPGRGHRPRPALGPWRRRCR